MVSKKTIPFIIIAISTIVMFGFFRNLLGGSSSQEQLKEVINSKAFLVDVRTPSEFAAGSVKGAVNIPLDKLSSQLDKFKKKEQIVVFCRSGSRSGQAKRVLEQNGFKNVTNGGTWQSVQAALNDSK